MTKRRISIITSIMFIFTFIVGIIPVRFNTNAEDIQTEFSPTIIYRASNDIEDCVWDMSYFMLVYNDGHIHIEAQCVSSDYTYNVLIGSVLFPYSDMAPIAEQGKNGISEFKGYGKTRYNTRYDSGYVQYDFIDNNYNCNLGGITLITLDLYVKETTTYELIPIKVFGDDYELDSKAMGCSNLNTSITTTTTATTTTTSTSTSTTTTTNIITPPITTLVTGKCGEFAEYIIDSNGDVVITGIGDLYDYVEDFNNNRHIKNVYVRLGITKISENTFYGCTNIDTVFIPPTVIEIDKNAFESCTNLSTIKGYTPSIAQQYAISNNIKFNIVGKNSNCIIGDANNDREINMADAVFIMQVVSNPDKYKIEAPYTLNADVDNSGDITNMDALIIQRYKLGVIEHL